MKNFLIGILLLTFLSGCAGTAVKSIKIEPPAPIPTGVEELKKLPPIDGPIITIAVYGFQDKTGQRKPSSDFSQLSTAVTQGADSFVIQALQSAGDGTWFKVLERASLDNLVKERQLIRSTREIYDGKTAEKLKPMLFAGLLLDGAIVGYDSNIQTGGVGARYFGIGTSKQYRTDRVSVSMRIVSVNTGEILLSVLVDKTIASYKDGADVFRFLDLGTRALEIEIGSSINEPVNYAVQCAIEQAVIEIIKQGKEKGLWKFKLPVLESDAVSSKKDTALQTNDSGNPNNKKDSVSDDSNLAQKLHDNNEPFKNVEEDIKGQNKNNKGDNR